MKTPTKILLQLICLSENASKQSLFDALPQETNDNQEIMTLQ